MASTGIDCHRCGNCKGFLTKAGLASHQRSSNCWPKQQGKPRHVSKKPEATTQGRTTLQDGASVHHDIVMRNDVVRPVVYSQDSMMLLAQPDQETMSDSTFLLVDWIRTCNNGKGLSKQDTQALLDVLFDPRFYLKAVTVKNAEDVARYEEELKTFNADARNY